MSLSILSDDQIRVLLESLTLEELEAFRDKLKESLHDYSNGVQSTDDGTLHQPLRTSVQRKERDNTVHAILQSRRLWCQR